MVMPHLRTWYNICLERYFKVAAGFSWQLFILFFLRIENVNRHVIWNFLVSCSVEKIETLITLLILSNNHRWFSRDDYWIKQRIKRLSALSGHQLMCLFNMGSLTSPSFVSFSCFIGSYFPFSLSYQDFYLVMFVVIIIFYHFVISFLYFK